MTTLLSPEKQFNAAMLRATQELDRACEMVLNAGWPPERCRVVENVIRIKRTLWVDYHEKDGKPAGVPVFEIEVVDNFAALEPGAATGDLNVELQFRWINKIPEYQDPNAWLKQPAADRGMRASIDGDHSDHERTMASIDQTNNPENPCHSQNRFDK